MKKMILLGTLVIITGLCAFVTATLEDKPFPVPASPQRLGNVNKGREYLFTGDYVQSGVPYNAFIMGNGLSRTNYLEREGLNKNVSHEYTVIKASNGEVLVAPNCLQCHAQVFEGRLIMGLGNSLVDFTSNQKLKPSSIKLLEKTLKTFSPRQYEASASFLTVARAIAPYLHAPVKGVNIADRLAALLVAHRDPVSFKWNSDPMLEIPDEIIPTDTPPWWTLKKKNAMFYNGFGRGDFGRFLMASNLLTVNDTSESRNVDEHMPDVLAYLYSLEAPLYPGSINSSLAATGKMVFEDNCSGCHGSYGEKGSYPNLLIPESIILTDSFLYKSNYSSPQFVNWFNRSWFTQGDHPARLEPFAGYMAPPLDGVWITAPYLHNGSVPNLEALLNSPNRPRYWSRDFDKPQYDYENIGWKFKTEEKPGNTSTYNTDLPGYGNYGHYFGDALTDTERRAVIEYLKTL